MLKEIVNQVNEAFIKNDIEGFLSNCTDDIIWFMSGTVFEGKEAVRSAFANMPETAPEIVIDQLIAEADTVVAEGSFQMKKSDGSTYKAVYCDIYRFESEKISKLTTYVVEVK